MMNRYLVVARNSTCPRRKSNESSFEELRRANYERDDRERENWQFHHRQSAAVPATYDRSRYVNPAE